MKEFEMEYESLEGTMQTAKVLSKNIKFISKAKNRRLRLRQKPEISNVNKKPSCC